jgi:hypothetical protein
MMQKKKKICNCGCEKEGYIWSQGMLKECFLRLNPPKKITYKSAKQKIKDVEKRERTKKLHEWFLELFDKHCLEDENGKYVICFESGKKLYEKYYKYNTSIYHHILEKNKYLEYEFEEWNIVFLSPEIHDQVHKNIDKTPKVKEKTNELRIQIS